MPVPAIPLILTAAGEFAASQLMRQAVTMGTKKFIQTYGTGALTALGFTSLSQDTPKKEEPLKNITESLPTQSEDWSKSFKDADEGREEETTGTELSTQVDEQPPKLPEEPPKGPDIGTELATEALTQTTKKLLEDKKPDISKQTKELVPEKPEFGKLTKTEKQTAKALKEGKSDFYSRAVESIKNAKPDKLTKNKWKSYIESTKDEMDYLGLTEFLQGNESITKKELLKFVESKNIAPNITVRSIPKDQMNPLYERYSLGGKQEHIVFQIPKGKWELIDNLYKEPHFDTEYGTGTFAHARVQVGFDEGFSAKYDDVPPEVIDKLKNTQIIDEIQSQWLQTGRNRGFFSDFNVIDNKDLIEYLDKNNIEYKILPQEEYGKKSGQPKNEKYKSYIEFKPTGYATKRTIPIVKEKNTRFEIFTKDGEHGESIFGNVNSLDEAKQYFLNSGTYGVPDFPIKESTKWVELVLTKLIEKAILDGRDSIAITNGQIQYNRYPEMEEKKRQGLKKFYDTIVIDGSLEKKFADKYNVELERINLQDPEQALMDQEDIQMSMPRQVKTAQDAGHTLQILSGEMLYELVNNRDLPGHASIYSNEGRGQGVDHIMNTLSNEKQLEDNYYIWTKENISEDIDNLNINRDFKNIVWDMPIVPVDDTITNPAVKDMLNASSEDREYILKRFTVGGAAGYPYEGDQINNIDLIKYTEYLRNYKPPEGVDLGYDKDAEQLIFMKFPKKLQKERLSKPIKLSKAKQQTERLFA